MHATIRVLVVGNVSRFEGTRRIVRVICASGNIRAFNYYLRVAERHSFKQERVCARERFDKRKCLEREACVIPIG